MRHRRRRFQRARKQQQKLLELAGYSTKLIAACGRTRLANFGIVSSYNFRWPPQTLDEMKNAAFAFHYNSRRI